MQLGMIGLGRMGANMVRRLMRAGHELVVFDVNQASVDGLRKEGAQGSTDLAAFVGMLRKPRAIWLMIPAALVDQTIDRLVPLLSKDDAIIDGGNSHYHDDIRRAEKLAAQGVRYADVGTSGGIWGLERGYCQMIGGDKETIARLDPIFAALAPPFDSASRTPGRAGSPAPAERGYLHCGGHGAGHFVKMVHNGIEYGLMAAYAEGLNILKHANAGHASRSADAETSPLREPRHYQYEFDLPAITELWRRGSVVTSWLLDLTAKAMLASPQLENFSGRVSDSGEGRWTIQAAVDEGVPAPVLTASLFQRFSSRGESAFADRILSAMRYEFGGHSEKHGSKG